MKSKLLWALLIIGLFILIGNSKFLNILGENTLGGITQVVVRDQNGGFVFTPDSELKNIECPGINSNDPRDLSCGSEGVIWINDKVYSCNADSIEFLGNSCSALSIYPKYKQLCDLPQRRVDGTISPSQPVCSTLVSEFGSITNPLSSGDIQYEVLFRKVNQGGGDRLIHDIKTITITNPLKCGDNICSVERDETYLNCNQDCPPPDCKNGIKDGNEQGVDCGGQCINSCDLSSVCNPEFVYEEWTSCKNNVQSRGYKDNNNCGKTPSEPLLRSCINENPITDPIVSTSLSMVLIIGGIIAVLILWWYFKKKR